MMIFRVIGRLTVRFFAGLRGAISGILRSIIHHPISSFFSLLVLGLVIASWIFFDGFGFDFGSKSDAAVLTAQPATQSNGKSDEFLNAYGKLDAAAMWNLMAEDFRRTQQENGIANAQEMQKRIDDKIKELNGGNNTKPKTTFLWNNGRTNSDGSAFDVFVGDITWAVPADKMPKSILYGITSDKSGKVKSAFSQVSRSDAGDPILTAAFPTKKTSADGTKAAEAAYADANAARNAVADEFMAGMTNFDAKRIWNTLSPNYQKELSGKNVSADSIQKIFDRLKKTAQDSNTKLLYQGYTLRQTVNYPNGNTVNDYFAALQIKDQVQLPDYVLLLDVSGKIAAITTTDPYLSQGLGRAQQ